MRLSTLLFVVCLPIVGFGICEHWQNEREAAQLLQEIEALRSPSSSAYVDG